MAVLATALTTLNNVKAIAGIPSGVSSYDTMLELLINRMSATMRKYLNKTLTRATYTEHLTGTNTQFLITAEDPIVSITSIYDRGLLLELNKDYLLSDEDKLIGRVYKENGWRTLDLISGLAGDARAAARTIDIIYVAGYYLPADTAEGHYVEGADSSLPLDIQEIVDEKVVLKFMKNKIGSQGLSSYSEGGISMSWEGVGSGVELGLTDEQAATLEAYKRHVVA
jgi:hypothetical protein